MKAVILAGGKGMRLRPYTTCIPKPLVPIGDMTMIEVLLRQLKAQGFMEVSLAVGHLGDLIESFVGDGSRWDLRVDCWQEDQPLGTAGPLMHHRDDLPDDFVVLNSDLLCDIDLDEMLRRHVSNQASLTVAASSQEVKVEFGVLAVNDGRLASFEEKPGLAFQVNMGIYCVSRTLLGSGEPRSMGFDDLLRALLARGDAPHIYPFDGYWLDIGRPDDYDRANRDFPALRDRHWRLAPQEGDLDLRSDLGGFAPAAGSLVEQGAQNGKVPRAAAG
jgi:mannose-1-phosphate guanylyltransferase